VTKQQQQKIVQYLNEAHGAEVALVRQLQAQIAMTPSGQYREGLETHLEETRRHAERIERRLGEVGQGNNPLQVGLGLVQTVIGQALALTKTPVDLVRGSGGEEKVLKNAKDSCAAEAQEIARPSGWPTPCSATSSRCSSGCSGRFRALPTLLRVPSSMAKARMTSAR
jgi:hypothetical protein